MEILEQKRGGSLKKAIMIDKSDFPLTIIYKERYILILTKNDKLILNKATE